MGHRKNATKQTGKPSTGNSISSSTKCDDEHVTSGRPRNAANARERARMRVLSKAFVRLKTSLPWVPVDTKLSKLDTLRLASSYIAHLKTVLAQSDDVMCANRDDQLGDGLQQTHPATLTWPFSYSVHKTAPKTNAGMQHGGAGAYTTRSDQIPRRVGSDPAYGDIMADKPTLMPPLVPKREFEPPTPYDRFFEHDTSSFCHMGNFHL